MNKFYKANKITQKHQYLNNFLNIEFHAIFSYALIFDKYDIPEELGIEFSNDAFGVLKDEVSHFLMLDVIARRDNIIFGEYPVNSNILNDLDKCNNLLDHVCLISLTHESKAIDSGPFVLPKLSQLGDHDIYQAITKIVKDEEEHVKFGVKWFEILTQLNGVEKREYYLDFLKRFDLKVLGANEVKRKELGFHFYE